jgi:hypothetical protein
MYPNGWVKILNSGHRILGSDSLVKNGKASWRNSSMDIAQAAVSHNGIVGTIVGPGNYWQADDFEMSAQTGKTKHLRRRISRQIQDGDHCYITSVHNRLLVQFYPTPTGGHCRFICSDKIGKWFNIEVSTDGQQPDWYISEEKK